MLVLPIQTGSTIVSSSVPNRNTHSCPLAYTGIFQNKKKRIIVPVKCFYVEVNNHKFLIDGGWSKECVQNGKKHLGFALNFASIPLLKEKESAIEQLKQNHLKIESILMTHLDCDHVSGVHDFISTPIFASNEEIEYVHTNKIRYGKLIYGLDIKPLLFKEDKLALFGKSLDVFNDGSVIAYLTPTHSKGSCIYQINENNKYVLVVGDNGYNLDSWKKGNLPGPIYNKKILKLF